jgi:hypothetical protein
MGCEEYRTVSIHAPLEARSIFGARMPGPEMRYTITKPQQIRSDVTSLMPCHAIPIVSFFIPRRHVALAAPWSRCCAIPRVSLANAAYPCRQPWPHPEHLEKPEHLEYGISSRRQLQALVNMLRQVMLMLLVRAAAYLCPSGRRLVSCRRRLFGRRRRGRQSRPW